MYAYMLPLLLVILLAIPLCLRLDREMIAERSQRKLNKLKK